MRSKKYKPLTTRRRRREHKVRVEKFPNFNPSVRDIWKVMADGRIIYRRKLVATIEDDVLDMTCVLEDLVQDENYTFEDITRFMHFLPSLLGMCKAHEIDVTNIPTMPTLEDYKKWKDEYD